MVPKFKIKVSGFDKVLKSIKAKEKQIMDRAVKQGAFLLRDAIREENGSLTSEIKTFKKDDSVVLSVVESKKRVSGEKEAVKKEEGVKPVFYNNKDEYTFRYSSKRSATGKSSSRRTRMFNKITKKIT